MRPRDLHSQNDELQRGQTGREGKWREEEVSGRGGMRRAGRRHRCLRLDTGLRSHTRPHRYNVLKYLS